MRKNAKYTMVAATIAAATACALAVTIPASASTISTPNALQQQVNTVQQTGTVGGGGSDQPARTTAR
jgi:hypothetical protein